MINIKIDTNRCKGCGLCENVCLRGVIAVEPEAESAYGNGCAVLKGECIGCGRCALVCPDIAITLERSAEA